MLSGHVKECKTCKQIKPLADFGKNSRSSDGLKHECRMCNTERSRRQRANNPGKSALYAKRYRERNPLSHRDGHLRRTFGITLEEYDTLLEKQGGCCAICGGVNSNGENLSVDHDHSCCPTVKTCGNCVRGLLCGDCNRGLGLFKDSYTLLISASNYLNGGTL